MCPPLQTGPARTHSRHTVSSTAQHEGMNHSVLKGQLDPAKAPGSCPATWWWPGTALLPGKVNSGSVILPRTYQIRPSLSPDCSGNIRIADRITLFVWTEAAGVGGSRSVLMCSPWRMWGWHLPIPAQPQLTGETSQHTQRRMSSAPQQLYFCLPHQLLQDFCLPC